MNMKSLLSLVSCFILAAMFITGCKKGDTVVTPPQEAHFLFQSTGTYQVLSPTTTYKLPVGLTVTAKSDVVVNFDISSPTGAVAGTHYNLLKNNVTIPAGKAIDTLFIQGVFSQYTAGRKDTLVIKIRATDKTSGLSNNSTFTLFMRGPCSETEMVLTEMIGAYPNTRELFGTSAYGPYRTTISAVRQITATTGEITVTNIYDAGWNPIKFILDWTDPNNRTVTLVQQSGFGNAGTLSSAYAGRDVSVRPISGQAGTFSYCNKTLVLRMQLGVTGLGFFSSLYQVTMAR